MLFRHTRNILELTLYAGLSCLAAFIARLFPQMFYPVLILRFAVAMYCLYIIASVEQQKVLGYILLAASLIGFVGGYWDYIELLLTVDLANIARMFTVLLCGVVALLMLFITLRGKQHESVSNKQ